jgi:hemerythrin-like domain-containing protein
MGNEAAVRPDVHEMVMVHRVFRREYRLAPRIVAAVAAGDVARARVVVAHLTEMGSMLHHHHAGEDDLVWPRLEQRAHVDGDLVVRMQGQHEHVAALLHRVEVLLPVWGATADATPRDELADVLSQVSAALDEHLDEEEREVLPLVEQHLTAEEWSELGERGMASIPKPRLLVILGHILEEADEQERRRFLALAPSPARLAYKLIGRRKYEREVAELRREISVPQQRQG